MADRPLRVTLTLPRAPAERLRAMCHAQGVTASDLIERWIAEHDDRGVRPLQVVARSPFDLLRDLTRDP